MNVVVLTLNERSCSTPGPRTQVLHLQDALATHEIKATVHSATTAKELDPVLSDPDVTLVIAADNDKQINAVVSRMVRRAAPVPSQRPENMPKGRTIADLPPFAVLPLGETPGLVTSLGLPTDAKGVAAALAGGNTRRTDLLRHDGGGICLDGLRLGGGDQPWSGIVNLDDAVLTQPGEQILACVVANADGLASADGMELVDPDPSDGLMDVAVAVPVQVGRWRKKTRIEVRRGRGRAVAITPDDSAVSLSDGVMDELKRKRTWWIEPNAAQWFTLKSEL